MKQIWAGIGLAALLGGCASVSPQPQRASANIADAAGRAVGRATVRQVGSALRVRIETAGLQAGTYGVHLHAVGRCDPPGFASAGPHWNPTARQHGRDNPQGAHLGDLPNLRVGQDRRGQVEYDVPASTLLGSGGNVLLDADGAVVVIHAHADDYRTDPSGNSGVRIACGVLSPG